MEGLHPECPASAARSPRRFDPRSRSSLRPIDRAALRASRLAAVRAASAPGGGLRGATRPCPGNGRCQFRLFARRDRGPRRPWRVGTPHQRRQRSRPVRDGASSLLRRRHPDRSRNVSKRSGSPLDPRVDLPEGGGALRRQSPPARPRGAANARGRDGVGRDRSEPSSPPRCDRRHDERWRVAVAGSRPRDHANRHLRSDRCSDRKPGAESGRGCGRDSIRHFRPDAGSECCCVAARAWSVDPPHRGGPPSFCEPPRRQARGPAISDRISRSLWTAGKRRSKIAGRRLRPRRLTPGAARCATSRIAPVPALLVVAGSRVGRLPTAPCTPARETRIPTDR